MKALEGAVRNPVCCETAALAFSRIQVVRSSLASLLRTDVERVEADAAELLGADYLDADAVDLTLVSGKVWAIEVLSY